MKKEYGIYAVAFVAGILVWTLVSSSSGRREAWDSELYFTAGIPVLCVLTGILGFVEPNKSWRWGLVPALGQAVAMFVSQGVGNLAPLGIIALSIFSIPSIVTARIGAVIVKRAA